jgi:23S rRNA (pseudouridine1915-N3)-methyltransferase
MKILIAAIGKAKSGPEAKLFDEYVGRVPWKVALKEFDFKAERDPARRTAREGEALLKAVPEHAAVVVLDERGKLEASAAFAARIGKYRDSGRGVAFLIGGADGHAEAVRARADHLMALGPMTWPHMLVRALLAEQLFRAHSILTGHPYHRG